MNKNRILDAPETVIYAAGGTRRSAVLAGINPSGSEYARWAFGELLGAMDIIFESGTNHIITHAVIPPQYQETTPEYRTHLFQWVERIFGGRGAIKEYKQRGWNVGLLLFGRENLRTRLAETDAVLRSATRSDDNTKNLWLTFTASYDELWGDILETIAQKRPRNQPEAISQLCGAEIPPASLFFGYGKLAISPATVHPILMGDNMACYWKQQPGYRLSPDDWQKLLYDYAITRHTWAQDKTGRAEQVVAHATAFENAPIVGIGNRVGPFWLPAA